MYIYMHVYINKKYSILHFYQGRSFYEKPSSRLLHHRKQRFEHLLGNTQHVPHHCSVKA